MALAVFDAITINISRVLEALLDEFEYRLAKRALRHAAAKARARRRSRTKVLSNEVIAASSGRISVRAA